MLYSLDKMRLCLKKPSLHKANVWFLMALAETFWEMWLAVAEQASGIVITHVSHYRQKKTQIFFFK